MIEGFILAMMVLVLIALGILAFSNARLWVEMKAMQKSTHTLTYIDPLQQAFNKPSKDDEAEINKDPFDTI